MNSKWNRDREVSKDDDDDKTEEFMQFQTVPPKIKTDNYRTLLTPKKYALFLKYV